MFKSLHNFLQFSWDGFLKRDMHFTLGRYDEIFDCLQG